MCDNTGRKLTMLPVQRLHLFVILLIGSAVLAMGADTSVRLERCEAAGRGQAQCRLLVLGR